MKKESTQQAEAIMIEDQNARRKERCQSGRHIIGFMDDGHDTFLWNHEKIDNPKTFEKKTFEKFQFCPRCGKPTIFNSEPSYCFPEPEEPTDADITCLPGINGWFGIRHNDGWWVGTDDGPNTYEKLNAARIAMTILWQREGGGALDYKIERFSGNVEKVGEFTPLKSGEDAILEYEDHLKSS